MRSTRQRARNSISGEDEADAVIEVSKDSPRGTSKETSKATSLAESLRKSPRHAMSSSSSPKNTDEKISPIPKQEFHANVTEIKSMPKFPNAAAMEVETESLAASIPSKARRGRKSNAQKALERETQTIKASQLQAGPPAPAAHTARDAHAHPSVADTDGDPKYDIHPLKVGHHLLVRYRDGSDRLARIVEVSPQQQYYVHYLDFNRRMDEWLSTDRIVNLPSVANRLALEYWTNSSSQADAAVTTHRTAASTGQVLSTVADLDHDEHEGLDEESLLEHEKVTKVKNIRTVQLGRYIMECWYFSPFPREYYPTGFTDCLYFCEFSMRFFRTKPELVRYQSKPGLNRYPPGNEIYRDENVSFFELDGAVEKIYCQNLCYFAKLFLDHKTLYWDVDQFLFYVLCVQDDRGYHPVGYFSKEKYSDLGYNLACILTFPCYQRRGYGRVLMEFSYELSKKEEKIGSPEKPLSDLGAVGYRSYWASVILRLLRSLSSSDSVSIVDIACMTSIMPEDIVSTLHMLGLLHRHPSDNSKHVIIAPPTLLDELILQYPEHKLKLDPTKLHWAPFYVLEPKKDKWSVFTLKAQVQAMLTSKDKGSSSSLNNFLANSNQ
eukprot:gene26894-32501_t